MSVKQFVITYDRQVQRVLEILPGLFAWVAITMPIWLSLWAPSWVAYIVLGFVVYWFYRSAELAFNAVRGYLHMKAHQNVDWMNECVSIENAPFSLADLHHVFILPSYKEPYGVLQKTLHCLAAQTFPTKQISVVFATEERDQTANETAQKLEEEFSGVFAHFWVTVHPVISGEVAGKSSNLAYAGKWLRSKLDEIGMPIEQVTVTSCDADSRLPEQYYAYLSYLFLTDPDRYLHFYQGALMFYNNIWKVPLPIRVVNTIGSIMNLSKQVRPDKLVNVSTYSLSMKLAEEAGYWAVDVIPEDWHLFFKAFFAKGGQVSVVPIHLPIYSDAAESTSYFGTMKNQYEQLKRWAWGVTDIPFLVKQWLLHPEIPFIPKTLRVIRAAEVHLLWPVNWFIITLGAMIPAIINPEFGQTVLGRNLPVVAGNILTVSALFLGVVTIVDWKAKPPRPESFPIRKTPLLFLQWVTMPVIGFVFGALPGLDAHTRLMLGKYMEYRVTEKVSDQPDS